MTAQRWWVRLGARWLARIDGVSGQLNLLFTAMSGIGIVSGVLKFYGLAGYVPFFLAVTGVGVLAYSYFYNEGGVRNQTARDNTDLSTNYSGPTMFMDDVIIGVAVYTALTGEKPEKEDIRRIEEAVSEPWLKYRDGIDVHDIQQ